MKYSKVVIGKVLLIGLACLTACWSSRQELNYDERVTKAKERLQSTTEKFRPPTAVTLVKRVDASTGGVSPGCGAWMIQSYYGTNDYSFQQVMDYYSADFQAQGWDLHLQNANGRSFTLGDKFSAAVYDRVDASFIGRDATEEGRKKYQTVYLLDFYTSLVVPVPSECVGG